jgi:hypothetical protein
MAAKAVPDGAIDARPVRPESDATLWDSAVARRDEIAATLRGVLAAENVEALVLVSASGNYPPWVTLEAWLPADDPVLSGGTESERVLLEFVIDVKPYAEHRIVTTSRLTRGKRKIVAEARPHFHLRDADEWARHAIGRGPRPSSYRPVADAVIRMLHRILWIVPAPHRNRVDRRFRTPGPATAAALLALAGVYMLGLTWFNASSPQVEGRELPIIGLGLLGIAGLALAWLLVRRRKRVVYTASQPVVPPRDLGLVDSWHAVVAGLGRDWENVKRRLVASLAAGQSMGAECRPEIYGYRTPNGYEERERLVISKGQGLVHLHVYPFGDDMFVGWQACLNWARWAETAPVATRVADGLETQFVEIRPGGYIPNQFDLIDLNSLSEFVHRRLERELKAILKEQAIDQEIDFQIIRGDRDRALDKSRHGEGAGKKKPGRAWSYRGGAAA